MSEDTRRPYREVIERCRAHYQNLPPHVKERDTAQRLHDMIFLADILENQVIALDGLRQREHTELTDAVDTLRELRQFDRAAITELRTLLRDAFNYIKAGDEGEDAPGLTAWEREFVERAASKV